MFPVFALIFFLVPLLEIYLLIQIGSVIGALWTVIFVVLTAVIGVQLLRHQGLSTISRAQSRMQQGQLPALELMEGFALVISGAFLLTPGFFTDTLGFILLVPAFRRILIQKLQKNLVASGRYQVHSGFTGPASHKQSEGDVIEGVNYRHHNDS